MKEVRRTPTRATHSAPTPPLDDIDLRLLRLLADDARMPNVALAKAAGIAPSTCLGRVRELRERGAIRGFHADIDPEWLGRPIQAFVAVRLQSGARTRIRELSYRLALLPDVLNVYFLAGANDFQLHVACESPEALSNFVVDHLSASSDVALTETNLIFQHITARVDSDSGSKR